MNVSYKYVHCSTSNCCCYKCTGHLIGTKIALYRTITLPTLIDKLLIEEIVMLQVYMCLSKLSSLFAKGSPSIEHIVS